jgi:hypothetical protein
MFLVPDSCLFLGRSKQKQVGQGSDGPLILFTPSYTHKELMPTNEIAQHWNI